VCARACVYERNGDCDDDEEEKVKERRRMRKRNSITAKAAANAFDRWMSEVFDGSADAKKGIVEKRKTTITARDRLRVAQEKIEDSAPKIPKKIVRHPSTSATLRALKERRKVEKKKSGATKIKPKAFRRLSSALESRNKRQCPGGVCKTLDRSESFFDTPRTWQSIPYRHVHPNCTSKRLMYGTVMVCSICYDAYATKVLHAESDVVSRVVSRDIRRKDRSKRCEKKRISSNDTAFEKKEELPRSKLSSQVEERRTLSWSERYGEQVDHKLRDGNTDSKKNEDVWSKLEEEMFKSRNLDMLIEITDAKVRRNKEEEDASEAEPKERDRKQKMHPLLKKQIEERAIDEAMKKSTRHRLVKSLLSGGAITKERIVELKKLLPAVKKEENKSSEADVQSKESDPTTTESPSFDARTERCATVGKVCENFTPSDFLPKYCSRCSFFRSDHLSTSNDSAEEGNVEAAARPLLSPSINSRLDKIFSLKKGVE